LKWTKSIRPAPLLFFYNTSTNSGLISAIGSVFGGVALLSGGSIDVVDFPAQAIYNIASPGTANMAISAAISPTPALCCNITGMANPPRSNNTTTLYVTINGLGKGPRPQLAVPQTPGASTCFSGAPLTFPNDVA
jgi:hypothetical protein